MKNLNDPLKNWAGRFLFGLRGWFEERLGTRSMRILEHGKNGAHGRRDQVVIRTFCAVFLACMVVLALRSFGSQYDYALAQRGRKTIGDYRGYLERSIALNGGNGLSRFFYANLLGAEGECDAATEELNLSRENYRPWSSWEQDGILHECLAQSASTSKTQAMHLLAAKKSYEELAMMRPEYVQVRERMARMSVGTGDTTESIRLAWSILRIDMNNLNAVYVLAKAYEMNHEFSRALGKYEVIAAAKSIPVTSIFQRDEITSKIRMMKLRSDGGSGARD